MTTILAGFTVALGLIVAIGAQNAWVLSMSVRRIYPWHIAVVCFTLDAVLMAIGVLFMKQLQSWLPALVPVFTLMGVGLLVWLALQAALRAFQGNNGLRTDEQATPKSLTKVVITAMGVTLLNPHVYLDTVILVGSIAAASNHPWLFWLGAASASVVWFSLLAGIGKPLSIWLKSTRRWQIFDGTMAVLLAGVAYSLLAYL